MSAALAIALATSMLAAFACYASSRNCLWTSMYRWRKSSGMCAAALAVLSIGLWIGAFGVAVGICAMLCACMLTLAVLPWLALLTRPANAAERD